jgi:hypothetical protein
MFEQYVCKTYGWVNWKRSHDVSPEFEIGTYTSW